MKLALLGYGRMGKTIEGLTVERGHEIVYKTSSEIDKTLLKTADVAIDFSIPDAAFKNITTCFELNVPVVSGTTGWLDRFGDAVKQCQDKSGAFIYASNFSIGVNLFFKLNQTLAKLMTNQSNYKVAVEEIHHTKKLDAPSGTAISLANDITELSIYESWHLVEESSTKNKISSIPIKAVREKNVSGTHSINYASEIDTITIKHTAHSRHGFGLGAVIAAEFLKGRKGVFTMQDVLQAII